MRELYGRSGMRFLALLLGCQFLAFGCIGLTLVLYAGESGDAGAPRTALLINLWLVLASAAAWVALCWEALSGPIFRLGFVEWRLAQRCILVPGLILCLLGAAFALAEATFAEASATPLSSLAPVLLPIGLLCIASALLASRVAIASLRLGREGRRNRMRLAELREVVGAEATSRIERSNDLFFGWAAANPLASQRSAVLVGLTSKPWHDRAGFEWLAALEEGLPEITDEALALIEADDRLVPYRYPGFTHGSWLSVMLFKEGERSLENCNACPRTVDWLAVVPGFPRLGPEVQFSILGAGSRIKPHRDSSNRYLTCQLPLVVPPGCGIRVGGEERSYEVGECMVFDTSYEHEVWNDSDASRVALLIDFPHPDLTEIERMYFGWSP